MDEHGGEQRQVDGKRIVKCRVSAEGMRDVEWRHAVFTEEFPELSIGQRQLEQVHQDIYHDEGNRDHGKTLCWYVVFERDHQLLEISIYIRGTPQSACRTK
jgi:hypothetical protein